MIWIGLPAYNEAGRIKKLLMDIHKSLSREAVEYKVIIYDDGSSDDTVSEIISARDLGVKTHLIKGGANKGLGHALLYLVEYCADTASPEDMVIIMDADATHNPEHIHRMSGYIKDGFDVVIASRYTPYSRVKGLKFYRRVLSNAANLMFKIFFPIRGVSDYSCAYRAYTAKILKLAKEIYKDKIIEERGFSCMAEFLIKLRRLNILACEVPLVLRYDKKAGPTKMKLVSNILRTIRMLLRSLRLNSIPSGELEALKEKYNI